MNRDKWRYACPHEKRHRNLEYRPQGWYYCHACQEAYDFKIDMKTGREIHA